jgi:hypothetical protein
MSLDTKFFLNKCIDLGWGDEVKELRAKEEKQILKELGY